MKLCSKDDDNSTRVSKCNLGSKKVPWYASSIRKCRGARRCYKNYIEGPFYFIVAFFLRDAWLLVLVLLSNTIIQVPTMIKIVGSDVEKMKLHQEKQPPQ